MSGHVNKTVNPDGSPRGRIGATAYVADTAHIGPAARVFGNARVSGDAQVVAHRHVLTVGPVGSEDQTVTLWRTADGHGLSVGCWRDHTVDELAAEVERRAPQRAAEYAAVEVLLRLRIAEWAEERKAVAS